MSKEKWILISNGEDFVARILNGIMDGKVEGDIFFFTYFSTYLLKFSSLIEDVYKHLL